MIQKKFLSIQRYKCIGKKEMEKSLEEHHFSGISGYSILKKLKTSGKKYNLKNN